MHSGQIENALAGWLAEGRTQMGQVLIQTDPKGGFRLCHREDAPDVGLCPGESALELSRDDDANEYRPLKTAPNLRHGWSMDVPDVPALRLALDAFYPGRLGAFLLATREELKPTPLRETLGRQTGMYRVAARVSDEQATILVGDSCRSDGGCLRTILWRLQSAEDAPIASLPPEKFDAEYDQTGAGARTIPLLCQEACALLVAAARETVKGAKK